MRIRLQVVTALARRLSFVESFLENASSLGRPHRQLEEARLTQTLAQAYENALPPRLFSVVVDPRRSVSPSWRRRDCVRQADDLAAAAQPRQPSHTTQPDPGGDPQLFELGFGREPQRTRDDATFIAGAEWWVQQQRPRESIGYHYDKDEALASAEMTMRFPGVDGHLCASAAAPRWCSASRRPRRRKSRLFTAGMD